MKSLLLFFILTSFLCANEIKEILLLHSYNKGLKWTDGISKGVEDTIVKYPDYELTTEYMDSKKIESFEYFNSLLELYKKKFSQRKYKAIIVADNYAYEFALKYHDEIFKDTPIIFCGVENFNSKDITLSIQNNITGVIEYKDIRKNLELMYKLFPNLKMVYIVSDDSYSSLVIQEQIINESNEFKDKFRVVFDNQIDFEQIDEKINKLPKHSAILFTSFYKDMYGNYIPYAKLQKFFTKSKFPVFALNQIHLGEGVIGGLMINPEEQGSIAAQKAFDIIDGKKPNSIHIETPAGKYWFDNVVLKKFGITLGDIPSSSNVINGPSYFYEEHRKFVENAFALMPLLLILTAILVLNIIKRISLEKELVRQNKLDNVLLNNIQSAIFWKSKEGMILGCNDLLSFILKKDKFDIIGNNVNVIMPTICTKIKNIPLNCSTSQEIELLSDKGIKQTYAVRKTPYSDEKNNDAGIVTILTDITEKKRIDTEHKRHEQFVIQRSKQSEVGEMLTSIAHQWKSPLIEISAIAQELLYKHRKKPLGEDDTQKFVEDIMIQVQYMSNTIDDFRSFIKPSTQPTLFDTKTAVRGLLNVVNHSVKYNYIALNIHEKTTKNLMAYGYPNEFKQCILNIINNAKDGILKKRESMETEGVISIELDCDNDFIFLTISDDGCGIEEGKFESVFEPFMSTKATGDGFGLYMARLIIEDKMNGIILASKNTSGGATIAITIPKEKELNETTGT